MKKNNQPLLSKEPRFTIMPHQSKGAIYFDRT